MMIRRPLPAPQPPKIPFLATSDPRRPQPQEAGAVFAPAFTAPSPPVRQFLATESPLPPYVASISFVRGFAGDAVAAPISPPAVVFTATDAPWSDRFGSDDRIFPPRFLEFDPLSAGAFLNTTIPWQGFASSRDGSVILKPVAPQLPTLPANLRAFVSHLSYQSPWRQDDSKITPGFTPQLALDTNLRTFLNLLFTQPPILQDGSIFVVGQETFASGSPSVPENLRKFITVEPLAGTGFYVVDLSKIIVPIIGPTALPSTGNRRRLKVRVGL